MQIYRLKIIVNYMQSKQQKGWRRLNGSPLFLYLYAVMQYKQNQLKKPCELSPNRNEMYWPDLSLYAELPYTCGKRGMAAEGRSREGKWEENTKEHGISKRLRQRVAKSVCLRAPTLSFPVRRMQAKIPHLFIELVTGNTQNAGRESLVIFRGCEHS